MRGSTARGRKRRASFMKVLKGDEGFSGMAKNMLDRSTAALAAGRMSMGSGAQRSVNHRLPPTAQPGNPARAH